MWYRAVLNRIAGAKFNQLSWCNTHLNRLGASSCLLEPPNRYCHTDLMKTVSLSSERGLPYLLTKEEVHLITNGEEEREHKLSRLQLLLYQIRENGSPLPLYLRLDDLRIMMTLNKFKLHRQVLYVHQRNNQKAAKLLKRQEGAKLLEEYRQGKTEVKDSWLVHALFRNSIFPRVYHISVKNFNNAQVLSASPFSQKVVIDCSFESDMNEIDAKKTAGQLLKCYSDNRQSRRPFSLHLCNLLPDSVILANFKALWPSAVEDLGMFFHFTSYLEVFDKSKLVYIVPNSTKHIAYDPDDIYIMGGMVNSELRDIFRKKAVYEQIRYGSLPLSKYLSWKKGKKGLAITQHFRILHDVKNTGDWSTALATHVPSRKIEGGKAIKGTNN